MESIFHNNRVWLSAVDVERELQSKAAMPCKQQERSPNSCVVRAKKKGHFTVSDIAKDLGISALKLNTWLIEKGFILRKDRHIFFGEKATAAWCQQCWVDLQYGCRTVDRRYYVRWTAEGRNMIVNTYLQEELPMEVQCCTAHGN